jgi:endo-1,4-beta-xylanase
MKSGLIQPEEGQFNFELSDKFVEFGEQNNMFIIGHALIWHSQAPGWFFKDDEGNQVSREVMIERMKKHIYTLVGRYKGRINGWDVVNEAINDDGSWRENKFYQIIGKEYVSLAFQFAHEADPDAELYYNDYSMAHEGRRNSVVSMVKELQEKGLKIDGIGMQGHCIMDFPIIEEYEKSIIAFAALNVNVMVTEMDLSILPQPTPGLGADVLFSAEYRDEMNPYVDGLPDSVRIAHHDRYLELFKLFIKHHDKISRVTLWGVTDNQSWKNNWPIRGRTDYPLLFDRNYQPKPIVNSIINEALKTE